MKYAILFAAFGLLLAAVAVINGSWGLLLLWPGAAFLAVAGIYWIQAHEFWKKGSTGRVSRARTALLAPYTALLLLIWHAHRLLTREQSCDLVIGGTESFGPVWIGRWPFIQELPGETTLVVDLLAEWPARSGIVEGREYRSVPILDGCAPADQQRFVSLVQEVACYQGTAYVHCAMGHGRSGLFVAAVMLRRGLAVDIDDAVKRIRLARPRVRLNESQLACLRRIQAQLTGG